MKKNNKFFIEANVPSIVAVLNVNFYENIFKNSKRK